MDPLIRINGYNQTEWALVSRFIEEARQAVRADADKVPVQFKPVFDYLADNLLSSKDARIGKATASAGLKGNHSCRFRKMVGMGPKDYIDHHRAKLAQRILQNTKVYVGNVASTLGFEELGTFSRWYERVIGHVPSRNRNVSKASVRDPRLAKDTAELVTSVAIEDPDLSEFWYEIRRMEYDELKLYLWTNFASLELRHFYFLLEKAKIEGRRDRKNGEKIVRSAISALKMVEFWSDQEFPDEKVVGYSTLANVCKLQSNMEDASEWSVLADRFLFGASRNNTHLFVEAGYLKVSLLWWKREVEPAIKLFEEILPDARKVGDKELRVRTLLVGADIYDHTGRSDEAIPLFTEAINLIDCIDDPYVKFSAHFNLALLYMRAGDAAKATATINIVKEIYAEVESEVLPFHVAYLEGAIARLDGAFARSEKLFLEAKAGFSGLGHDIYTALVLLELALLYCEVLRTDEALSAVFDAIPVISRYSYHREAIAALSILQEASERGTITKAILERALGRLERVRKDPTEGFQDH